MLVQWPWGPQEAPELHSSTSVGTQVSEGVWSRDTARIPLGPRGLEQLVGSVSGWIGGEGSVAKVSGVHQDSVILGTIIL